MARVRKERVVVKASQTDRTLMIAGDLNATSRLCERLLAAATDEVWAMFQKNKVFKGAMAAGLKPVSFRPREEVGALHGIAGGKCTRTDLCVIWRVGFNNGGWIDVGRRYFGFGEPIYINHEEK